MAGGTDVGALIRELVEGISLTGASLSRPRRSDPSRPARVTVAPVMVGGSLRYRFTAHHATRSNDENLTPEAAIERLTHLLETGFRQGLLQSTDADWQVLVAGKEVRYTDPFSLAFAARTGQWDDRELVARVERGEFSLIALRYDIFAASSEGGAADDLTPGLYAAIRAHYRVIERNVVILYAPR